MTLATRCCCLYDDVVDHVNAGVDDVKVGMQERGRVESSELERGNPGTSGLHPIHTRTLACVAFVTNIFMDVPSNYLCGVMIESIMEVPHLDTWTKMFIHP